MYKMFRNVSWVKNTVAERGAQIALTSDRLGWPPFVLVTCYFRRTVSRSAIITREKSSLERFAENTHG